MFYLSLFWILFLVFIISFYLSRRLHRNRLNAFFDTYGILLVIILGSLLVVAIVTNDPVSIAGLEIPVELQWLGSLIATGFGAWKFYLNPLKNKVQSIDREVGEVKSDVSFIKNDIHLIKERLLK